MGANNYYSSGNWNIYCDFCGQKKKSKDVELTWNGFYVCRHHREVRNPQDFQVSAMDDQSVPFSRPNPVPSPYPIPVVDLTKVE